MTGHAVVVAGAGPTGMTLAGELAVFNGLVAVLARLVTVLGQLPKTQPGPDQDRQHREQLQGTVA